MDCSITDLQLRRPVSHVVSNIRCALGENPLWDVDEEALYWCDISAGRLYRYHFQTGISDLVYQTPKGCENIGGFTIETDGALLLFMDAGRIERWTPELQSTLRETHPEMLQSRFNDVIADPQGRVFCGSMSTVATPGKLYRLDRNMQVSPVLDGVGCSNGMAFGLDGRSFYHTDSFARTITKYLYDESTGDLGEGRLFVRTAESDGLPDGLTMDREGCLWSAHWDGGFIVRYDPSGHEIARIEMPIKRPTSLAFGGRNLSELFVTSARDEEAISEYPLAGALFRVNLPINGRPEYRSRIFSK